MIRFIQNCKERKISLKRIRTILELSREENSEGKGIDDCSLDIPGRVLLKEEGHLIHPESGQLFLPLSREDEEFEDTGRLIPFQEKGQGGNGNLFSEEKSYRLTELELEYQDALDRRNSGEMRRILKEIVRLDSGHTGAWIELGNLDFESGALDEAILSYDRALESDPVCVEAIYNTANIYYRQKKFAASIRAYEHCMEMDPEFGEAYYNLGILYFELKQMEQAEFFLQRYLEIDPESIWGERAEEILDTIEELKESRSRDGKLL